MLLDSCVIQNMEWVWSRIADDAPEPSTEENDRIRFRYGSPFADELFALEELAYRLRWSSGFPWLVSPETRLELERTHGPKGEELMTGWSYFAGHSEDWAPDSFGSVAPALLFQSVELTPSPLILKGLGVENVDHIVAPDGPLRALRDDGDRRLVRAALLSGVRAILTTDLRSFGSQRAALFPLGIEVWRPSDVLSAYLDHWSNDLDRP
jgi:hypothetical protein